MTGKTQGRDGWHQATPKTVNNACHFIDLAPGNKAAFLTLTGGGRLRSRLAHWVIQRRGLDDD